MKTLIYDGDCGFCTRVALWVERKARDVRAVAWHEFDYVAVGLSQQQVSTAAYFIDKRGEKFRGTYAFGHALMLMPLPLKLIGPLFLVPPMSWIARALYPLIARFRYRLPGATDACRIDRKQ